jgi:hypothetical protein
MQHREIAKRVGGLEAAVECAMAQYNLCKKVFNESASSFASYEFCDGQLLHVLIAISGQCTWFYLKGDKYYLTALKPLLPKLQLHAKSAFQRLCLERNDGQTMRHAQLNFFIQSLQYVEKRLDEVIYAAG